MNAYSKLALDACDTFAINHDLKEPGSGLRSILRHVPTPIAVVTTVAEDSSLVGVTIGSFTSLSLDPPLIMWNMMASSRSLPHFRACRHFNISILASDQNDLSQRFAKSGPDKFEGVDFVPGRNGVPNLVDSVAWLECDVHDQYPGGDHFIFVGRVQVAHAFPRAPLAHWQGAYATLQAISA